jgi:capsular exopolysaccharide synthesis family protein
LQLSPDQALSAASLSQNPRYQNLLNELKKVEQEIAVKKARYNEGSPVIEVLRDRERNLNSLLRQEAGEILGVAAGPEVLSFQDAVRIDLIRQMVTAANNVQMLQIRSQEIAQVEAQLDQRLQSIPAIVRRYSDLVQELDIATKTLNQFLLQRETLRVEAAQKEVPWEVIAQPRLFSDARGKPFSSKGKAQRTLLMGVAAGVFLGLLAALLRDRMSNKFYSFEDVRDGFAYPFLGTIPTSPMMGKPLNGHRIQSSKEFFDAFNTLYTNLRFLKPNNVVKSIVVTSIEPRDGKTTIASNLAQTTANMGQRVLLVDANLRNPSLHDYFNLSNRKGLADVLMGQVELDLAVQQSHTDNLTVLPAGQIEVDPARLMASANMQNFLKQAQAQFDVVILDASHLQEQADVHFLAPLTDGMLLVVGVQKTPRSSIKPVMDDVQKYRLPVIGVVANGSIVGKASTSSTPSETTSSGYQKSALFGNFKALQSNSFNAPNEFKPVSQSKSADESTDLLN